MSKTLDERVRSLSIPASKVVHSKKRKVVTTIRRSDIESVNRSIEPKIRHNAEVMRASWIEGKNKILK